GRSSRFWTRWRDRLTLGPLSFPEGPSVGRTARSERGADAVTGVPSAGWLKESRFVARASPEAIRSRARPAELPLQNLLNRGKLRATRSACVSGQGLVDV